MAIGDDLSAMLPPTPPPRPVRRDATIAAALRRFDGEPDVADPMAQTARPVRWHMRRSGVLASVLLVAVIGVPATLIGLRERPVETAGEATSVPAAAGRLHPNSGPTSTASAPITPPSGQVAMDAPPPMVDGGQQRAAPAGPQAKLAPAPTASFAVQERAEAVGSLAAAPVPAPPAPPPPPPPPTPAAPAVQAPTKPRAIANQAEESSAADASQIVVTGSRMRSRAQPRDDETAVRADGRSIGVFLDRALAYQRQGNLDRALAELNRAHRLAPDDARILRQRSALYRQLGDLRRAERDERRLRQMISE